MSATLTWYSSGLGTKTGTTINAWIADLVTLISSKSADANFSWAVASSNSSTSPLYIVLKPKSGAAGRILLLGFTSAPGANHATLFDTAPQTNNLYVSFFPAGNADTPSNLTAASGTILGDDTGALKVNVPVQQANAYVANYQPFYFDCAEAAFFCTQNPAAAGFGLGAGYLVVDAADNAYAASLSMAASNLTYPGNPSQGVFSWQAAAIQAGSISPTSGTVRTNYGSNNRVYYSAWGPMAWSNTVVGASDILTDTSNSKAWFVPHQLLGLTKGEGFVLKLRQIAYGPASVGPLAVYQTSGPVVQARQMNAATAGGAGCWWLTNFKI